MGNEALMHNSMLYSFIVEKLHWMFVFKFAFCDSCISIILSVVCFV